VEGVIRGALSRSGVEPGEVVTIKAHGTGTVDNDLAEGRGIARVFGASPPAFASLKGALGHTLGAAGALEVALWLGALSAGFVPGSVGFAEADPDIGVTPTVAPLPAPRGVHLFNAFGFGGSCVAFAVRDA
jgi:3-oxoacyl-(acyl-carrier-protein) synthase